MLWFILQWNADVKKDVSVYTQKMAVTQNNFIKFLENGVSYKNMYFT
jgi:hypothetical protein